MATVATMAVNVIAQTGGFEKGLDKASAKTKGFGSSIGGAMGAMVNPAVLATAAVAAVGAALMKVNAAMERLDEIAKKSKSLGISGQTLMEFQHAAELAGVSAGGMSKGLQKMQKGIGEALGGTGLAKDALEMMGIELQSFGQLDADEQFLQLADKIASIQNPAERAAMATAMFGRAGADMLPLLMQGREAIEGQMDALKALQGELSEADLQAIEDANDAWTRVGKAFDGIWNQLSVLLAPMFEALADILIWCVKQGRALIDWFLNLGTTATVVISIFFPLFGILKAIYSMYAKEENAAEKASKSHEAELAAAQAAFEAQQKAAEEAAKAREALEKKGASLTESLRTPLEKYNDTMTELNMMLKAGVINWQTYGRAVQKAQDDIKKSEEFAAKEIKVAEQKSVGVALRGRGAFSIQQKQQRALEKIREEERLQLIEQRRQTALLNQLNQNISTGTVVTI